ncbi:MAG: hypothetical protein Q8871_01280, partial [Pigeon pea little leaf phytoplasma]|nr:hypothetical protein [Pigeon pea little leaf phytoplasma]
KTLYLIILLALAISNTNVNIISLFHFITCKNKMKPKKKRFNKIDVIKYKQQIKVTRQYTEKNELKYFDSKKIGKTPKQNP